MRYRLLIIKLCLFTVFCQGQTQKEIVLLSVRNDRAELAGVLKYLNANYPKLICVNVDLFQCENEKPGNLFPNHEHHINTRDTLSVIYPSVSEKILSLELSKTPSLIMPSKIEPFGDQGYAEISGCGFLYFESTPTGFIDLLNNEDIANQVEKFQVSLIDPFNEVSYHFATKIAYKLNVEKTQDFIKSHGNVVNIDFEKERKFDTYRFDELGKGKVLSKVFKGKVIIISVEPSDYFLVRKNMSKLLIKMSTSEIFANIVCQILDK